MVAHSTDDDTVAPSVNAPDMDSKEKVASGVEQPIDEPAQLAKVVSRGGNPPEEEIVYPSGAKVLLILVGLMLAVFLVALDQTIIAYVSDYLCFFPLPVSWIKCWGIIQKVF